LLKFLRIPVDQYNDLLRLLQLSSYANVISLLDYRGKTQAASYILQNMIENVSVLMLSPGVLIVSGERFRFSISSCA
uniref:ATPase n=1 Tax=Anisakis simplex TaxID=6269 RepID=A0A0M3JMX3_ANISI